MADKKLYKLVFDADDADNEIYGVNAISLVDDPAVEVIAVQLSKEEEIVSLLNEEIVAELNKLGQPTLSNNQDYILMDAQEVDSLDESVALANEDNKHFQIRYKYDGPNDSKTRSWCKTMLAWDKEWTRDEIELLDNLVTPGMGPRGANSYSVFRYKGSVNCRHRWLRLIYWNSAESPLTYEEALAQMPKNLIKQIAKVPKEMSEVANASNNYWKLKFNKDNNVERVLTQPILIPGKEMYRQHLDGYIYIDEQTIRDLSKHFFKNGFQTNSTLHHDGDYIDGFCVFESWIIEDPNNDKANSLGFKDLPKGTWMVSAQLSQENWDKVESGEVKGLSIEAILKHVQVSDSQPVNLKKQKQKQSMNNFIKGFLKEFSVKLSEELNKVEVDAAQGYFVNGEVTTDAVLVDADEQPVANHKFTFGDVEYITDENGVIDIFIADEAEVELEDEQTQEEAVVEEVIEALEEVTSVDEEQLAELQAVVEELTVANEAVVAENVELKRQLAEMKGKVELSKQPARPVKVIKSTDNNASVSPLDVFRRIRK